MTIEPDNPTILSNLGLNRHLAKNYQKAIALYQKAYQISDATYHMAAINLGLTYYYNEEYQKGIEITSYVIDHSEDETILSTARVHRGFNYYGNLECNNLNADIQFILENYHKLEGMGYHITELSAKLQECDREIAE